MKITFIITSLAAAGAEIMLYQLLRNMDRSRFEITVISLTSMGEIGPRIEADGFKVHALGMNAGAPSPTAFFRLVRLLRRIRPDVVHTWMYHADFIGGLAARLAGCNRVIWGLHNTNLSKAESKWATLAVVFVCARFSRWLPTRIASCSQRAKEVHAQIGYMNEKFCVIPNGFDLTSFSPSGTARTSLCAELGLPDDVQLVGMVGRYHPQKNHLGFVLAAARVLTKLPTVHFVLAGAGVDGRNTALKAAMAAHPNLPARMHLLGRRDDVSRLMAALDVLALPSSFGEAFPLVLGEAMGCGVPCVVTDVGDAAEIVGSTGRVVAVDDMDGFAQQLVDLLCLPADRRRTLGLQARARVQAEYEIGHVVNLYQTLYDRVAQQKNK
jgi:glycosyltransferase involved in cell wall biosynthesis